MKSMIAALLFVGSAAMGMTNMPEGVYQGKGRWSDNKGNAGAYDISATVKANVVASTYTFGSQTKQYDFEAKPGANGHFDVLVSGQKVGEGYCMSVQCHYAVSFGKTELEETLTFFQDNFYRIGSKQEKGAVVIWEESMAKQGK